MGILAHDSEEGFEHGTTLERKDCVIPHEKSFRWKHTFRKEIQLIRDDCSKILGAYIDSPRLNS